MLSPLAEWHKPLNQGDQIGHVKIALCAPALSACNAEHCFLPTAQTLITGNALTEHMEEFYLDTLRALATAEASITGIASELQERKGGDC